MHATRDLKLRMASGDRVFGQFIGPGNDPHPTVEALKKFGYDFVIIEREHSLLNPETVYAYIGAATELDMPILMRPEEHYANWRCFLDSGVNGLMLPHLDTVDEATQALDRAYFPPLGRRGAALDLSPFLLDGMDSSQTPLLEMTEYVNSNTVLFPQTESVRAINNLPQILALDGITGTIVGPNDLALDIGGIAQGASMAEVKRSAAMERKLFEIARVCQDKGKVAGIGGLPLKDMARWAQQGYQLFMMSYVAQGQVDASRLLLEEAKQLIGQ